jgi:O-succinylbenzoic acid--CoA ligase
MSAAGPPQGARPLREEGEREARAAGEPGGGNQSSAALSIFAAAREAGDLPALDADRSLLTFAALAALVRERIDTLGAPRRAGEPSTLTGAATVDALVTLYAHLERRTPVLLLHPRLTAPERDEQEAAAARAGPLPHPEAAAIIYTSGTTGTPRAAVLSRGALEASASASAANLGWQADDRWLLCMPIAHVGGLSIVTRCLIARRCVVLTPKFDARQLPSVIADRRVTLASLVPAMLARALDAHPDWRAPAHLRAILVGGAAVPAALLRRAAERGFPLLPSYGLTESCAQIVAAPYAARHDPAEYGSGLPLPGVRVRIVDGRIEIRGPMLMAGYWNEHSLAPDAWFDTGDVGEIDARGCVHVHARRTDLIVTGGENVYPAEVERALEAMPGIRAAGVFGITSDEWGQEVAAALVASVAPPRDLDLAGHLMARLAPHKRPRHVCYVRELPHTTGGKLDRGALAACASSLRPLAFPSSEISG